MDDEQRPGGWVPGIGWVARLGDCRRGDYIDCSDEEGGGYGIVTGVSIADPELVVVVRWADGDTPAPPSPPVAGGAVDEILTELRRLRDREYQSGSFDLGLRAAYSNAVRLVEKAAAAADPKEGERR